MTMNAFCWGLMAGILIGICLALNGVHTGILIIDGPRMHNE